MELGNLSNKIWSLGNIENSMLPGLFISLEIRLEGEFHDMYMEN